MKLFINKLWWLCLTFLGYGVICFMLELPMTTIVYSLLKREDPQALSVTTFTVGFIVLIYMIYLKRLRNDDKRREYLTNVHRRYGSFKEDCMYIVKKREFQAELVSFSVIALIGCIYWCTIPFKEGQTDKGIIALWIVVSLLIWGLVAAVFSAGRLLIHNRTHVAWIAALEVPEEADEVVELRRKKRAMKRNLFFQFVYSLLFFVLWFLNRYAVTFAVVITPPLFVITLVQAVMGIVHLRGIYQPYKSYVVWQIVAIAVYIISLAFGAFAPKV